MLARFSKPALALLIATTLAACSVSPEQAQENRDTRLEKQFPKPADRAGLYIVWQSSYGKFNVEYLANEISEATAVGRVGPLCRKLGQGDTAKLAERWTAMNRTVTLGDGSKAPVRAVKVNCV
ncbi:MAG: hypothetical protein AAF718_02670 [Pseudomonadota bacterium]